MYNCIRPGGGEEEREGCCGVGEGSCGVLWGVGFSPLQVHDPTQSTLPTIRATSFVLSLVGFVSTLFWLQYLQC